MTSLRADAEIKHNEPRRGSWKENILAELPRKGEEKDTLPRSIQPFKAEESNDLDQSPVVCRGAKLTSLKPYQILDFI